MSSRSLKTASKCVWRPAEFKCFPRLPSRNQRGGEGKGKGREEGGSKRERERREGRGGDEEEKEGVLPPPTGGQTSSSSSSLKVVRTQLIHKLIAVSIRYTYDKIITEELVAFVNKLSVVASCSEIVVLICFIRKQR